MTTTRVLTRILLTAVHVIFASLRCQQCSGLRIEINPPNSVENVESIVDVSCIPDASDNYEPILLEISRNNEPPIALIRQHSAPFYGLDVSKRFHAEGFLESVLSESYLNLTLFYPRTDDAGVYKCTVFYLDPSTAELTQKKVEGKLIVEKLNITSTYLEMKDLKAAMKSILDSISRINTTVLDDSMEVHGLLKRVTGLEQGIKKCEQKESELQIRTALLEDQNRDQSQLITDLENKVSLLEKENSNQTALILNLMNAESTLQNKVSIIEHRSENQSRMLTGLADKASYVSAFSASISNYLYITKGMVVIFDNVILRKGSSGYNENTGVFTAPTSGLYFLYLFVTARDDGCEIILSVNDNYSAATYNYEESYWDQSAINVLLELQTGDRVKPVVYLLYGPRPYVDNGLFSMFGGYLVHQF